MYRYNHFDDNESHIIKNSLLFLVVLIYPVLVSMYPTLPPLIGLVGYVLISNMNRNKLFVFYAIFYLVNLDFNLTLPLILSVFIIIMNYIFIYSKLKRLIHCRICLLFTLIVLMDSLYYLSLFLYDFIFNTNTVIGDMLLIYYISIDILIGLFL